jgi:hypothetical protein
MTISFVHRGTYANCGPPVTVSDPTNPVCAAQIEEYNQCIFLRGFRVMDRTSHVLKAIRLKVPDKSGGLDILPRPWVSRSSTSLSSSTSSLSSFSSSHSRQNTLVQSPIAEGNALDLQIVSNEPRVISHAQHVLGYMLQVCLMGLDRAFDLTSERIQKQIWLLCMMKKSPRLANRLKKILIFYNHCLMFCRELMLRTITVCLQAGISLHFFFIQG